MKLALLPILCVLGTANSTPITLEERQFVSSFPSPAPGQAQFQQKATGALVQKAWGEVSQAYSGLTTAFKCVSAANPLAPPPSLLLNCGVGEAHKAIANKLWETTNRFSPTSSVGYAEAGSVMVAAATSLTRVQQTAFKSVANGWAFSVKTRERQLVYESLVQQLGLYQSWSKAYNNLLPIGTRTAGDLEEANIVKQYQALIKQYQWDVPQ
ncbi:hypothetical protein BLS_003618 [Venturia inaequalis]|uniref:Uncharacterized protein n=1 Tax=Venturia inaequalis TaxID=5025 RepID=A0A8H3V7N8_VENIN|nr:hypothetical protein BLS_003618 [Venturia inaequalis]KAE9984737.1 hypothetical protein EG328_008354 [Venturia inaequalis]